MPAGACPLYLERPLQETTNPPPPQKKTALTPNHPEGSSTTTRYHSKWGSLIVREFRVTLSHGPWPFDTSVPLQQIERDRAKERGGIEELGRERDFQRMHSTVAHGSVPKPDQTICPGSDVW